MKRCKTCKGLGEVAKNHICEDCEGTGLILPMFNSTISFRIREEEKKAAQEYLEKTNYDLYDSVSHFARCAWIKALSDKCGYTPGLVEVRASKDGNPDTND